jgi:hypothetical protein
MLETMRLVAPSFAREALVEMLEEARRVYQESQSRRTSVFSVRLLLRRVTTAASRLLL